MKPVSIIKELANRDLSLADIPLPNAEWDVIGEFALTFGGYEHWGSFEKCADIANAQKDGTLSELRTCLFFEQRRWRHFMEDPDDEAMAYIRQVVEKIRSKVTSGKIE